MNIMDRHIVKHIGALGVTLGSTQRRFGVSINLEWRSMAGVELAALYDDCTTKRRLTQGQRRIG